MKNQLLNQIKFFNTQKTKDYQFRINQLQKLKQTIIDNEEKITSALYKDLKKSEFESYTTEIGICLEEISYHIKHLKSWMKNQKVKNPIIFPLSESFIQSEPLGNILIISPWNYPFNLAISPLIGAISSGNCITIKPSEISIHTSKIIKEIIESTYNKEYINVILGGPQKTSKLLEQNFDYIFYTGSENVGKIILEKAAKNLTPTTLELGGKSPCIVDSSCDLDKTARRITFGKFLNCGQTCVAPDYLLVDKKIKIKLIKKIKENITKFYSTNIENSNDYGKIINVNHFNRLINYLDNQKIIFGGLHNKNKLFIEPTLININKKNINSKIMTEEIFGPILPIIEYTNIDDVIKIINSKPKPLAIYLFCNNKYIEKKVLSETSSGGVCINDTIVQLSNQELPFGGVGNSGFGKYHAKASFDLFSNKKSVFKNTTIFETPKRFPPYNKFSLKIIKKIFN